MKHAPACCVEKPHRSELVDRCEECGEELEHGEHCVTIGCPVYEASMGRFPTDRPGVAYRYEVQIGAGWHVPCETFRRALDVSRGQPWCRIVRFDYVAIDEDDDGLSDDEQLAISLGECELREALVAVIDGAAGKAA